MLDLQRKITLLERKNQALQNREGFLTENLQNLMESIDFGSVKPYRSKAKDTKRTTTKRIVNVFVSDVHFGADLRKDEVPLPYGTTEERRRMAALTQEVIEYKSHYRDNSELAIHLAGDIIQNRLHDMASAAPVAEQVTRAIYLLNTFVKRCAEAYPKVTVRCTPGNHGRIKDRHRDRAVEQKWDSFENIIYEALRISLADVPNVTFEIPHTPFYEYEMFGMRGFITHGDTVLNPGYPGKAVNVAKLEAQVLKLQAARGDYRLVGTGHVHVPSVIHLPSTVLVTNGCLIPTDPYGMSIGLHSTPCVQQLWETVPGYMFGDHRMLNFTEKHDKDSSLDKIIPADGFR